VLSATLPGLGAGALKNREDAKALGTAKVRFSSRLSEMDVNFLRLGIGFIAVCDAVLQDVRD
jgi:hypothetical protein